jgi:hypothetical protein
VPIFGLRARAVKLSLIRAEVCVYKISQLTGKRMRFALTEFHRRGSRWRRRPSILPLIPFDLHPLHQKLALGSISFISPSSENNNATSIKNYSTINELLPGLRNEHHITLDLCFFYDIRSTICAHRGDRRLFLIPEKSI